MKEMEWTGMEADECKGKEWVMITQESFPKGTYLPLGYYTEDQANDEKKLYQYMNILKGA